MTEPLPQATRDLLLQILQVVKVHQETVQDLFARTDALETALLTNPTFGQVLADVKENLNTSERRQAFAAGLVHIDDLIQSLLEPPTVH